MQLIIQNAKTNKIYECASITKSIEITTNRSGSAGKMTFNLVNTDGMDFTEGNTVKFVNGSTVLFLGYIFTRTVNRHGEMDITVYDQIRYLKANASYVFEGMTAGQIISRIANDFNLKTGVLEDTGYAIPVLIKENTSCLDIIGHAIQLSILNTGKVFVFYDDGGLLTLKEASHMMNGTIIGTKSLIGDYNYKTDIDTETYNQVKLVRPNKETGKGDTFIFHDSEKIREWGLLQFYDQVDEELNDAQIAERCQTMLTYYNRKLRSLSIDSLGIQGIRAGSMIYIDILEIGEVSASKFVLLDKVVHKFENNKHEMSIETRSLEA